MPGPAFPAHCATTSSNSFFMLKGTVTCTLDPVSDCSSFLRFSLTNFTCKKLIILLLKGLGANLRQLIFLRYLGFLALFQPAEQCWRVFTVIRLDRQNTLLFGQSRPSSWHVDLEVPQRALRHALKTACPGCHDFTTILSVKKKRTWRDWPWWLNHLTIQYNVCPFCELCTWCCWNLQSSMCNENCKLLLKTSYRSCLSSAFLRIPWFDASVSRTMLSTPYRIATIWNLGIQLTYWCVRFSSDIR